MQSSQAFGQGLAESSPENMLIHNDDEEDGDPKKRKVKAKKFDGLLEWVLG